MEGPPDERAPKIEDLYSLVREIERRVTALERERQSAAVPLEGVLFPQTPAPMNGGELTLPSVPGGIIPVLGRALLGIAGAYLLRAAAETGTLPQWAAVLAALLYAGWWLVSSTRVASADRFTTAVYGLTAAMVVAPMLWETTVRFQVLPPAITAAVLVVFVAASAALAWARNIAVIPWITTLAAVATTIALIVATHQVIPFTMALLLIAVVVETAACRDHWLSERWLVAVAADFAVFLMTYLVTRPNGVPEGYPPLAPSVVVIAQIVLLSVYLGSTAYRTLIHGLNISLFETGQAAAAFLISIGGALKVAQSATAAGVTVGAFAILSGAACYVLAFTLLEHQTGRHRNFYTYSAFGLALMLTGCYVLLSGLELIEVWGVMAAIAMWTAVRLNRTSLRVHSVSYALAAVAASGLIGFGYDRIIGPAAPWPMPGGDVALAAGTAALCYALARNSNASLARATAAILGAVVCWTVLALTAGAAGSAGAPIVAAVRTASICIMSAFFAWAGPRWNRRELGWLLYPLMIGGGIKLIAEDFRYGNTVTMCISLLFFGGALILLPRLTRAARKQVGESPLQAGLTPARRTT